MRPAAPEATKIARIGGRRPPPADGVSDRAGAVPTATATPRGGEDGQARRLPDHAPPGNLTEVRCARWYARPAANGPGAPPRMRRPHGPQAAPRGCSSMVELEPSKLVTRVRFPSPAPKVPGSNLDPERARSRSELSRGCPGLARSRPPMTPTSSPAPSLLQILLQGSSL